MSHKKSALAFAVLSLASMAAMSQTSVNLYGIVDAAARWETTGPTDLRSLAAGGMSQSRLGVNVSEDMGGGWRAVANLEHRLMSDTGAASSSSDFWRQAWVGLITPAGRITLGRQYNVMFDLTTSTYAAYKYSPYIEQFKPELMMTAGNRQSNMVKYAITEGGFTGEFQVSAGEGSVEKTTGFMVRYQTGGFAAGYGFINAKDVAGKQVKARTLGGSYTTGPVYLNFSVAKNAFDFGFNPTLIVGYTTPLVSAATAANLILNSVTFDVKDRDMLSMGLTYNLTPQFNLGAQFYKMTQSHRAVAAESTAKLVSFVADYALSKRTDVYVEWDRVGFGSAAPVKFLNGRSSRTGYMAGVRHRF